MTEIVEIRDDGTMVVNIPYGVAKVIFVTADGGIFEHQCSQIEPLTIFHFGGTVRP